MADNNENTATTVINTAGAAHIDNGPLTTSLTDTHAPGLLRNEIDRRIVKVRPMATPLDQISRMAAPRRCGSMKVDYYSVDTKPVAATVNRCNHIDGFMYNIRTDNNTIFQPSETVMFPGCTNSLGHTVVGYVHGPDGQGLSLQVVNAADAEEARSLQLAGSQMVRMGRAASELDVQTPSYEALPRKLTNFCQIFKAQIEQSTAQRLTNKEVGWTFDDHEEVAVYDMRLGMEKSFLFGAKAVMENAAKGEEVMLTGGVWHQAGAQVDYAATDTPEEFVLRLARAAFVGNDSSRRKVLMAGSDLVDLLSRFDVARHAGPQEITSKWGLDFTELVTKFGRLYVIHNEVFDACGMPGNGMVIDPAYITKYSFIPMTAEVLDLKHSGQRNTDAVVITEASCLVLRYPAAHLRVVLTSPAAPGGDDEDGGGEEDGEEK